MEIQSKEQVKEKRAFILKQVAETISNLKNELSNENVNPLDIFSKMKFEEIGNNPLKKDKKQNLIEQLNQTFTNLVICKALDYLLENEAEHIPFIANFGVAGGEDIYSKSIACEVFASVKASNNGKLNKDIAKVVATDCAKKYVFYYAHEPSNTEKNALEEEKEVKNSKDELVKVVVIRFESFT